MSNEWYSQISMEGTQTPRYDYQLHKPEKVSLKLNLENGFEIKGEVEFWKRQGNKLMGMGIASEHSELWWFALTGDKNLGWKVIKYEAAKNNLLLKEGRLSVSGYGVWVSLSNRKETLKFGFCLFVVLVKKWWLMGLKILSTNENVPYLVPSFPPVPNSDLRTFMIFISPQREEL